MSDQSTVAAEVSDTSSDSAGIGMGSTGDGGAGLAARLSQAARRAFERGWDGKREEDPRVRYHRPGLFKRFMLLLLPDRVSRIHLYEAQQRFVYLQTTLEHQQEVGGSNARRNRHRDATIAICRDRLDKASVLLTRRQQDLNFLWREMTQVHKMLAEHVFPNEQLPDQLGFVREEAKRIGAGTDPEVNEMTQRLAEVMDETKENRPLKVRLLGALIERFTTIRTGRMHQQFVNIRTYRKALIILVPVSVALIANYNLLLGSSTGMPAYPVVDVSGTWRWLGLDFLWNIVAYLFAIVQHLLTYNLIAFVFFGGLTGGFFSVVIRLRSRDLEPGEDAYFAWYVLTKPFVGALGAVVLFVLLRARFVSFEILEPLMQKLQEGGPGPEVFGFAFLAGLTERLAFPNLR